MDETRLSLGEIAQSIATLEKMILDGAASEELETMFSRLEIQLPVKVEGYHGFMQRLEQLAEYYAARSDEMIRVARSCSRLKDRLKDNLKLAMRTLGVDEIFGLDHRFKLVKAKSALKIDEMVLPDSWLMEVVTHVPDKERIRTALEAGEQIPGAVLEDVRSLRPYVNKPKELK